MLQEALEHLVKGIVDHPDDVRVASHGLRRGRVLEVRVHPDDLGKVIGRGGRGRQRARVTREFGINGESSGKDGVNTNERSSLVFSELRRVTCGVAVHKVVDNRCDVRITGGILWTRCGHERNLK